MGTLAWILVFGLLMSAIALVGSLTLVLREETLKRLLLPLVALGAGSMLGGAIFHLLPEAVDRRGNQLAVYLWLAAGFIVFLVLEQLLHWHHCHRAPSQHTRPLTWLILVADAVHNFVGGLAMGASFTVDVRLGVTTWLVEAAHEVPQELGDFGILVHGGWDRKRALLFNLLSGLTFPLGSVLAWLASIQVDMSLLLAFAAGNFLYICAVDLVPEFANRGRLGATLTHTACFLIGLGILLAIRLLAPES